MFRDILFSRKTSLTLQNLSFGWKIFEPFFTPAFARVFYTGSIANFSNLVNLHKCVLMQARIGFLNKYRIFWNCWWHKQL
jgi:hypothetical protein